MNWKTGSSRPGITVLPHHLPHFYSALQITAMEEVKGSKNNLEHDDVGDIENGPQKDIGRYPIIMP
jgi:hypothetical protein